MNTQTRGPFGHQYAHTTVPIRHKRAPFLEVVAREAEPQPASRHSYLRLVQPTTLPPPRLRINMNMMHKLPSVPGGQISLEISDGHAWEIEAPSRAVAVKHHQTIGSSLQNRVMEWLAADEAKPQRVQKSLLISVFDEYGSRICAPAPARIPVPITPTVEQQLAVADQARDRMFELLMQNHTPCGGRAPT